MEGLGMDAVQRLELETRLLREIDKLEAKLGGKADRGDITGMAAEMHRTQMEQADRNRSLKEAVNDLERGVKALASLIPTQPGESRGGGRFSLQGIDPRLLLAAGLAVGVAGGKAVEFMMGGGV